MRRRPVVVAPRRGPGLIGTMAQTAVIAGTATVVSRGVSGAMSGASQSNAAQQQAQIDAAAQQAVLDQQAALQAQQAMLDQQAALQAQQAAAVPAAAAAPAPDRITQLKDLAALRDTGVLSEEEFQAEKQRIMASS